MSNQQVTTPTETAEIIDITPVSLRRWCDYHAAHLSPGANPPAGQARRFTGRDIEVLKMVKQLREQGFTVARINEQLATLTFAEIDTSEQDTEPVALQPASPDAQHSTPAVIVALDDLQELIRAIQQGNQATQQTQRDFVVGLALGALGMGLLIILLLLLAVLYGGFR